MPISKTEVEHVASLAHVGLGAEEVEEMTRQLSSILDHVAKLEQVDTAGVPPATPPPRGREAMRGDVVGPSWPQRAVLANAPRSEDGFFEVQAIFD